MLQRMVLWLFVIILAAGIPAAQAQSHRGFLYADDYCFKQNNSPVYDQNCIQEAINSAPLGGTVYVGPSYALTGARLHGDGQSMISINKAIKLPGAPGFDLDFTQPHDDRGSRMRASQFQFRRRLSF